MKMKEILQELAAELMKAIPAAVESLKIKKPIAVVRLNYFDTSAPCAYLSLRIISDERRKKLLDDEGEGALSYLWSSAEEVRDYEIDIPDEKPPESQKRLAELCEAWYAIMDAEDADEEVYMPKYRKMVQGVAKELHGIDWSNHCPVTDDFAIAAADGSQCFADEYDDLKKSIPSDRLKLLRERGLLGPGEEWYTRPGFDS